MIQFIVLFISTILVGSLLYFYPPNIPLKMKMSLLGIAFLLALGGLFILDTLSLGLALAAITAISFIAAYLADKRVNFVTTTGQTEIVLSFSEEEAASGKVDDHRTEITLDTEVDNLPDSAILSNENLQESIELPVNDEILEDDQSDKNKEIKSIEVLESIELLDLENIENSPEEDSISEKNITVQELAVDNHLAELTDDELNFLTETREISEEEVTNVQESTDIEDKEILLQRAALLEELDEVEVLGELPQELPLLKLSEDTEEELSHDKDYVSEENQSLNDLLVEETLEEVQEVITSSEEETNTEEAHIMEEPIIEVEITSEKPIQVETKIETPMKEVPEIVEYLEENPIFAEQDEFQVLDAAEVVEEIEDVAQSVEETVEMSMPDMNEDLQDMFLSTLNSYEETGDHSSYQEMLVTLLNQKLSDKDFYLFSKLLLNSYMTTSNYVSFTLLIEAMEEKLNHYPVIEEELQRYKEIKI